MTELLGLLTTVDSWPVQPSVYVTSRELWAKKLGELGRTYVVGECDRNKPIQIFRTLSLSFRVIARERPDVIITTGSLPLALLCLVGKLFGSKIVWIDSVAQLDDLSMSGKLVRRFANVFLTQWPEVAQKYDNAEYVGELL